MSAALEAAGGDLDLLGLTSALDPALSPHLLDFLVVVLARLQTSVVSGQPDDRLVLVLRAPGGQEDQARSSASPTRPTRLYAAVWHSLPATFRHLVYGHSIKITISI